MKMTNVTRYTKACPQLKGVQVADRRKEGVKSALSWNCSWLKTCKVVNVLTFITNHNMHNVVTRSNPEADYPQSVTSLGSNHPEYTGARKVSFFFFFFRFVPNIPPFLESSHCWHFSPCYVTTTHTVKNICDGHGDERWQGLASCVSYLLYQSAPLLQLKISI